MIKVSAVIPVYNESKTIRKIVFTLLKSKLIDEIIVVNDGSTDTTLQSISDLDIRVINHKKNVGKDIAVKNGVMKASYDKILMLDGDLIGLSIGHIEKLLLNNNESKMILGIIQPHTVWGWIFFLNRYFFTRTGLRVVDREILEGIPEQLLGKYRLESILSSRTNQNDWSVKKVVLKGITHLTKEKKVGVKLGLYLRWQMILDIFMFYGERFIKPQ